MKTRRRPYLQHGRRHGKGGSDPIIGFPLLLWGKVFDDSDIEDPGSGGWTVASTGAGLYTVTFDPPFASVPTVVFSATNNNAAGSITNPAAYFVEQATDGVDVDHVDVCTFGLVGTAADGSFSFIAVGT